MRFDLCPQSDYHKAMYCKPSLALGAGLLLLISPALADTFRVATYNVENYVDQATESRKLVKSPAAKAKVRETILAMKPDVIALEEVGGLSALLGICRT